MDHPWQVELSKESRDLHKEYFLLDLFEISFVFFFVLILIWRYSSFWRLQLQSRRWGDEYVQHGAIIVAHHVHVMERRTGIERHFRLGCRPVPITRFLASRRISSLRYATERWRIHQAFMPKRDGLINIVHASVDKHVVHAFKIWDNSKYWQLIESRSEMSPLHHSLPFFSAFDLLYLIRYVWGISFLSVTSESSHWLRAQSSSELGDLGGVQSGLLDLDLDFDFDFAFYPNLPIQMYQSNY